MNLYLFGSLRLDTAAGPRLIVGSSAPLLGLLALRYVANRPISRSQLAGSLYPLASEQRARRLLTNALYRLRRALGAAEQHLRAHGEQIELVDVVVDLQAFTDGIQAGSLDRQLAAVDIYTADLLEELDAEWAVIARQTTRHQMVAALPTLIEACRQSGRFDDALRLAHRWTFIEPLDEDGYLAAMQLYQHLERPTAALQQYERLRTILATELAVDPMPTITLLAEQIRARHQVQPVVVPRPFIGRRQERATLIDLVEQLEGGRGSIALIEGEAGIGKTALLEEIAQAAAWRHYQVAWGHTVENEGQTPFAPLDFALRAAVTGPFFERVNGQLPPTHRQTLAPLIAPARPMHFQYQPPAAMTPPLAMAVKRLLTLVTKEKPLLLLLDDIQWAEVEFWDLLPTVAQLTKTLPLCLIAAYRTLEAQHEKTGWSALQSLDKMVAPRRLRLGGFTKTEATEFVTHYSPRLPVANVGQQSQRSPREMDRLIQQSGGNPLILKELLTRPDMAIETEIFTPQLAVLTPAARNALTSAAILGRTFSHGRWQAVVGSEPPAMELVAQQLLRETPLGYQFRHDLLRAQLLAQLSADDHKHWHRRAVFALRQSGGTVVELAWHSEQAGLYAEAIHYHQRAGQMALWQHAFSTAREHNQKAHELCELTDVEPSIRLPIRLLQLQIDQIGRWEPEQAAEAAAIAALARSNDDIETLHGATIAQLQHAATGNHTDKLEHLGKQSIDLARELGDPRVELMTLNEVAQTLSRFKFDTENGFALAKEAAKLARLQPSEPALQMIAFCGLASICFQTDRLTEAQAVLAEADHLMDTHGEALKSLEEQYLRLKGWNAQREGYIEQAYEIHLQRVALCQESGDSQNLYRALLQAAYMARKAGLVDEAVFYAEELLAHARQQGPGDNDNELLFYQALLADCYLSTQEFGKAERHLAPVLAWLDRGGSGRAAAYAWFVHGQICRHHRRYDEEYEAYQHMLSGVQATGSLFYVPHLCMAEAAYGAGRLELASEHLATARAAMNTRVPEDIIADLIEWKITAKPIYLARARATMIDYAYELRLPHTRQAFWLRRPLNIEVEAAWQSIAAPGNQSAVCALQGAPFGRPLTTTEMRTIWWTPDDGLQDRDLAKIGKVSLRHHRLMRLTVEANVQGTAPTHNDLAAILGVAVRTIERDAAALAAKGIILHTRRYFQNHSNNDKMSG